jgi:hypothetical protein
MSTTSFTRTALLMGAAFFLTACGAGMGPTAAAPRVGPSAVKNTTKTLSALEGPLTANRVLAFAHVTAREIDAKAAFTGLTGTMIGATGEPTGKGTWTVQYIGSDVAAPGGNKNPYANKHTRRIAVSVDAAGVPTVAVSTEQGMPLGVSYLENPQPEIDSCDVMNLLRRERPAHFPIERMSLSGHPRDYQVMLWKIGTLKQSGDRPITINATTGAIVTTPY